MGNNHVCPWWLGYLLINPLRTLIQNPSNILNKYISTNMKVMDVGCAMGYFSLPMARLVGEQGKVICIDLQEKMIHTLLKRAEKAGLRDRLETRVCRFDSLMIDDIKEDIDFALAFAVVHEVEDKERLFKEIKQVLKTGGRLLVAEPARHVKLQDFETSVSMAKNIGFEIVERPKFKISNSVLLKKV